MENKVSSGLKVANVIIAIVAFVLFILASSAESAKDVSSYVGTFLSLSYVLSFITLAVAIIFPVFVLLQDIKKGITFLIGAAVLAIIGGISWGMAVDSEVNGVVVEGSRMAEAGIIMFYILFVLAILAVVASSVKKLIS